MATTTYIMDYTVPAGATTHKATYGGNVSSGQPPPTPPAGTEGTQTNIDNIETSNDVRWQNSGDFAKCPYKIYRWYDPTTGTITQYTATAEGYNNTATPAYKLYIYNFNTPGWELLNSHGGTSDQTISGSVSANLANYRNASNYVYTATLGGGLNQLHDDFVKLDVTYTPADGGAAVVTKTYVTMI